MEEKVIAVICGNAREVRRAWYKIFIELRKKPMLWKHDFGLKWITGRKGDTTVTYKFYLPDLKTMMVAQWFDEVIWYGTVKSHPKYRDVVDYVRLHSRKVGEF